MGKKKLIFSSKARGFKKKDKYEKTHILENRNIYIFKQKKVKRYLFFRQEQLLNWRCEKRYLGIFCQT